MNSTPNLAVSNSANYLFDIDSLASTGCFISTVKTSQFLSISYILVGLLVAPLSCRKRALTGREAAELQEKEEARLRRRAQIASEKQEQNDAWQEQATALHSQLVATVAAEYVASQGSESHDIIDISSESDEFVDIDVLITHNQARSSSSTQPTTSSVVPSSSRPARERNPTTKQASQNRRIIEKEEKRLAKLARKPKT